MLVYNSYDKSSCVSGIFDNFENLDIQDSYYYLYHKLKDTPFETFLLKTCQYYPEYEESLKTAFVQSHSMSTFLNRTEEHKLAHLWRVGADINESIIAYMRDALQLLENKLNFSDQFLVMQTPQFKEVKEYVNSTQNVFYKIFSLLLQLQKRRREIAENSEGELSGDGFDV